MKRKLTEDEGFDQLYDKIVQLKMGSSDGKSVTHVYELSVTYEYDCTRGTPSLGFKK